jgi:hypothetical protein
LPLLWIVAIALAATTFVHGDDDEIKPRMTYLIWER